MRKFRQANVGFMLMMFNQEINHHVPTFKPILGIENVAAYSEVYDRGYTQAAVYLKSLFEDFCLITDKKGEER